MIGKMLGPYRIVRRLGSGAFGEVWQAVRGGSFGFLQTFALKLITPEGEHEIDAELHILADEASALSRLNHPAIVQVVDLRPHTHPDGYPVEVLVMEYVRGETLRRILAANPDGIATDEALLIADQLLSALHHMHHAPLLVGAAGPLVHRDLKPENVMITDVPSVKVLDLGIAHFADRLSRTEKGMTKGTPAYMAPERIRGADVTPSADLYSCGALLFELLTGERYVDVDAPLLAMLTRVTRLHPRMRLPVVEDVLKTRGVPPDEIAEWCDLLTRMLDPDPTVRAPSTTSLQGVVEPLQRRHPLWSAREGLARRLRALADSLPEAERETDEYIPVDK